MTASLFQPEVPSLRDYQREAVDAVLKDLEEHRATLVLMATGLGKTEVAVELIDKVPGRACFIAHREKLVEQAAARISDRLGVVPHIEQAQSRAGTYDNTPVVASIQSLARDRRLARFSPDEFSLIIVDEVHHGVSPIYRAVLDHFSSAKVVGLTATPDRADGEALGQIIDNVAYRYELPQAIEDGWLSEIRMRSVKVHGVDFSKIKTKRSGDFSDSELDAIMSTEESLHAVAKPTVDLSGDRPTIVFTTSIQNARRLAEIIDRYAGQDVAVSIDSQMPTDERAESMRLFESGRRRILVNVGIATEGYDHPPTSCIIIGRPTKSRALYTQMIGRGTRGGTQWPIEGKDNCLVIDFVGASEKHDIVTAADVLGGDLSDEDARLIQTVVAESDRDMSIEEAKAKADERKREILEAEEKQRQRRQHIVGEVRYRAFEPNPYVSLGVKRDFLHERYGYAPATEKQDEYLRKLAGKYADSVPSNLSKLEASRLIAKFHDRRKAGLATYPQMMAIQKFQRVDASHVTFDGASAILGRLKANRWRPLSPSEFERLGKIRKGER